MNRRKSPKGYTAKPMIGIANTDFELIEKCHKVLSEFNIAHYICHKYRKYYGSGNNKDQKCILVMGYKRAEKFIEVFGDFIRKQGQVNLIRKLIAHRFNVGKRVPYGIIEKDINQQLKILNHKGILRDYTPNTIKGDDIVRTA